MNFNFRDATALAGIASVAAGILMVYGPGWALVAAGTLLIGLTLIAR